MFHLYTEKSGSILYVCSKQTRTHKKKKSDDFFFFLTGPVFVSETNKEREREIERERERERERTGHLDCKRAQ